MLKKGEAVQCIGCSKNFPNLNRYCPYCGRRVRQRGIMIWLIGVVAVLITSGLVVTMAASKTDTPTIGVQTTITPVPTQGTGQSDQPQTTRVVRATSTLALLPTDVVPSATLEPTNLPVLPTKPRPAPTNRPAAPQVTTAPPPTPTAPPPPPTESVPPTENVPPVAPTEVPTLPPPTPVIPTDVPLLPTQAPPPTAPPPPPTQAPTLPPPPPPTAPPSGPQCPPVCN